MIEKPTLNIYIYIYIYIPNLNDTSNMPFVKVSQYGQETSCIERKTPEYLPQQMQDHRDLVQFEGHVSCTTDG